MSYWFIFQSDRLLLLKHNEHYVFLTEASLEKLQPYFIRQHTIGEFNGTACFCATLADDILISEIPLPYVIEAIPLKKAFEYIGAEWYHAAAKAYSINTWDKTHLFCGCCGHATEQINNTFERMCLHCKHLMYPRISPSIIVRIRRNNEILMARSPHFLPGLYGLIAGFVEPGESIEQAVHREVKEEVGLQIHNLTYFGSQSWPFPDSLMIAFTADYLSGEIQIDPKEIEDANWYTVETIPNRATSSVSIARKLIDHFIAEQTRA